MVLLFALLLIVDFAFGQGCSQCKLVMEQAAEADEASFGSNINKGILFLMAIPYLIIMFLFRNHIFRFFKQLFKAPAH